jgi:predicted nucleic acid-binding protein
LKEENKEILKPGKIANNVTLVTHNTREFSRVEGLVYEDWEE